MTVEGTTQWVRNPQAGSNSGWRGVSLWLTTLQNVTAVNVDSVQFDYVNRDTDSFVSTGTETLNGITFPAGSCAIIPAGLAGIYLPSFDASLFTNSTTGDIADFTDNSAATWTLITKPEILQGEFAMLVNDNEIWKKGFSFMTLAGNIIPFSFSPDPVELAEGDKVGFSFTNTTFIFNEGDVDCFIAAYFGTPPVTTRMMLDYRGPA